MRRDVSADLARVLTFENSIRARLSEEQEDFRWGTGRFNLQVPEIYDVNYLLVDKPDEDMTIEGLVAEADRLMAPRGFHHRKIVIEDDEVGESFVSGFRDLGWSADRLLFMVYREEPERSACANVDEVAPEVHVGARYMFDQESPYFEREEGLEQMRTVNRMVFEATDKRCFAAYVDGTIASVCELYSDGITAQIENVATLEQYQKRGLATATVLRALHEARTWGHDLIFLVADDDDWPKEMYAKLGFEGVGRTYQFLLKQGSP